MPLSNKTLIYLISLALLITLFGTAINLSRLGLPLGITGATTIVGNASITINAVTEINMTGNISYGAGNVNAGQTNAQLDTSGAGYVLRGSWSVVGQGFIIENTGNVDINLTVTDYKNSTATSFIGGSGPQYNYTTTEFQGDSCASEGGVLATNWPVNFTAYNNDSRLCANHSFVDSADMIEININLTIPIDSIQGYRQVEWTFSGTQAT